jgi:hypothetical protein
MLAASMAHRLIFFLAEVFETLPKYTHAITIFNDRAIVIGVCVC